MIPGWTPPPAVVTRLLDRQVAAHTAPILVPLGSNSTLSSPEPSAGRARSAFTSKVGRAGESIVIFAPAGIEAMFEKLDDGGADHVGVGETYGTEFLVE